MEGSLTFLGTGTSMGVPTLGCGCAVCTSADPRDRRLRPAVLVRWNETDATAPDNVPESAASPERVVVIDTGPDFREQALRSGVKRVDAVFYTHSHADHILGLDDLRPLSFRAFREGGPVPLYATADTTTEFNEYGFTLGSPVYIPKLYNGKNKVFWFLAYEGVKHNFPQPIVTTVPTAPMRSGDFSRS